MQFPRAGQRNKTILTLEKLEPGNIWHRCFKKKNHSKDYLTLIGKSITGVPALWHLGDCQWLFLLTGARTSQSALKPAGCAVEEASRWQTDRQTGRRTTEADWADFCIKRQRERESFFGEGTEIGTPTQSGSTTSWHLREPTAESWAEHDRSVNAFIFCQRPLNPQHLLVYIP